MGKTCFGHRMVLVEYSDSEDESSSVPKQLYTKNYTVRPLKRKRRSDDPDAETPAKSLPPLPSSLRPLYATNVRSGTSDDPALHGGRTRQIPHVEGNWPTHVFLEWMPAKSQLAKLDQILAQIKVKSKTTDDGVLLHSFLRSDLGVQLPLHISLSAPLVLTTRRKENFKDDLVSAINSSVLGRFTVAPNLVRWVANHDASRYFLILGLEKPEHDQLNLLLQACNRTAEKYQLSKLYYNTELVGVANSAADFVKSAPGGNKDGYADHSAAFHISIAWSLHSQLTSVPVAGDERQQMSVLLEELGNIGFSCVKVKIGNIVTDIPLSGD